MDNIHEYIKKFFPIECNSEKTIFFEAGIHIGEDTEQILNHLNKCSFYGFEPDPRNIDQIKQSGLDKRISFYPIALSNSVSTADFHMSNSEDNWGGSSSLKKPKLHLTEFKHIKFDKTIQIPTTTVDFFCEQNNIAHIDFMWLDTQGAEKDIISGSVNMLHKIHYIYFEFYDMEIYEGQPKLSDILNILGPSWSIIEKAYAEILVENKNYKQ